MTFNMDDIYEEPRSVHALFWGDSLGFILFDHIEETVDGMCDGFGVDEPFDQVFEHRSRIAGGADLGAIVVPGGDGVDVDVGLGQKPLTEPFVRSSFENGLLELAERKVKMPEKKAVDADRAAQREPVQQWEIGSLCGAHFIRQSWEPATAGQGFVRAAEVHDRMLPLTS